MGAGLFNLSMGVKYLGEPAPTEVAVKIQPIPLKTVIQIGSLLTDKP